MQKQNQGRPRSKAFFGSDHHKELFGTTHWDVMSLPGIKPQAIQVKRMKLANKAMAHSRSIVEKPANVARKTFEEEDRRYDEFTSLKPTRRFALDKIVPRIENGSTMSKNFGALAATTTIKRQGACMEMSALTLTYLGEKRKKYSARLSDPDISEDDRVKYQFKSDALNEVHLMQGVDKSGKNNHMWARIGKIDETNAVSADAWGRGSAKPSSEFNGSRIFSEQRGNTRFDPQMMIAVSDISKEYSKDSEVVSGVNKVGHTGGLLQAQEQHDN